MGSDEFFFQGGKEIFRLDILPGDSLSQLLPSPSTSGQEKVMLWERVPRGLSGKNSKGVLGFAQSQPCRLVLAPVVPGEGWLLPWD